MENNLIDLQMMQEAKPQEIEIPPDGISLDLLRAVYRNSSLSLSVRIRAAGLAIPYETPKLIATAVMSEGSFADLLERRLKRIAEMRLIEARPDTKGEKIDARLPPVVPDRRFRRI